MRKTNEGVQIQTALEKAERRLVEAIEYSQKKQKKVDATDDYGSEHDHIAKLKEESESARLDDNMDSSTKSLYGFAPDRSRSGIIENDISEVPKDKLDLLKGIMGEKAFKQAFQKSKEKKKHKSKEDKEDKKDLIKQLQDELKIDDDLFNDEFHGGYDALKDIAKINDAIAKRTNKSIEQSILSNSWEYEIKSFNEGNVFDENSFYEVPDIMPSEFELHSFDDEEDHEVVPYDVNEALLLGEVIPPNFIDEISESSAESIRADNAPIKENTKVLDATNNEILERARAEAEKIINEARKQAEQIIANAEQNAEKIIEEKVNEAVEIASKQGYEEGYKQGEQEGFIAAEDAVNIGMKEEAEAFRIELQNSLEDFDSKKDDILHSNINELTELAVNIAEKVINVSLKSSKDVVAKMIIAAAEQCRNKEWAKVYISHEDKAIAMNLEKGLLNALNQISPNVKVVVMDDEPSGTCIIETSDQIVDAGVATQMDNIRQIVSDSCL
ncbi:MAG: FliH/SctL family protein [Aminipila sp.]